MITTPGLRRLVTAYDDIYQFPLCHREIFRFSMYRHLSRSSLEVDFGAKD